MTSFESGDVVRVPFPFVERNQRRARPALVVSTQPVGPDGLVVWALMITNASRTRWPEDVEIRDTGAAGLPIPSLVRTAKIATLETATAERIGRIGADELRAVRSKLAETLGLA